MAIIESSIAEDRMQIDGRRSVRERHVDETGAICEIDYLAEKKDDIEGMLPVRAAQLDADRARADEAQQLDQAAEKRRAAALLKLADDVVVDVLKLGSIDEAILEKARLADVAAAVDAAVAEGGT